MFNILGAKFAYISVSCLFLFGDCESFGSYFLYIYHM